MDWSIFLSALLGGTLALLGQFVTDWLRGRHERRSAGVTAALAVREAVAAISREIRQAEHRDEKPDRDSMFLLQADLRANALKIADREVRVRLFEVGRFLGSISWLTYAGSESGVAGTLVGWTDEVVGAYVRRDRQPKIAQEIVLYDELLQEWERTWRANAEAEREYQESKRAATADGDEPS